MEGSQLFNSERGGKDARSGIIIRFAGSRILSYFLETMKSPTQFRVKSDTLTRYFCY